MISTARPVHSGSSRLLFLVSYLVSCPTVQFYLLSWPIGVNILTMFRFVVGALLLSVSLSLFPLAKEEYYTG